MIRKRKKQMLQVNKINDMTKNFTLKNGENLLVEFYQSGAYLLTIRTEENGSHWLNVNFAHHYATDEDNASKELNTDLADTVNTFLSCPLTIDSNMAREVESVNINLSSFNGSLEEAKNRNQQAMEAIEAAESFNRLLENL